MRELTLIVALAWLGLSPAHAADAALPPLECVELLRQARLAKMHGDPDRARASLQQAAESFPDELIPLVALLEHHREFDAPAEDVNRLRGLLTGRLADPERLVPQGTLAYLVGDPDARPEELAPLVGAVGNRLAASPEDPILLATLAGLQRRLERWDDLHVTLQRRLELNETPEAHWQCMSLDTRFERWGESTGHVRRLIELEPDSLHLRMLYVEFLAKSGSYDALIEQLDAVQARIASLSGVAKAGLLELLLSVAWELRDSGQHELAEGMFRRLLALDGDHASARKTLLHFYATDEERAAHQAELEKARSEESDPHVLLEEGASLLAGGDATGAFDLLQRAAADLPDSEIAQFNLGLAAIRLERWEEAASALGRAAELNPSRAEAHLNRGIALTYVQRFEDATVPLLRSVELQPDLTQAHYYLYQCYKNLGQPEQSNAHLLLYNESVEQ
ncbi:MAG: tetratricopeptide repeat protein [bacterium]|nr:tetratricopeptide repeat protein [bacterium]